jgi:hypothetical protein
MAPVDRHSGEVRLNWNESMGGRIKKSRGIPSAKVPHEAQCWLIIKGWWLPAGAKNHQDLAFGKLSVFCPRTEINKTPKP